MIYLYIIVVVYTSVVYAVYCLHWYMFTVSMLTVYRAPCW